MTPRTSSTFQTTRKVASSFSSPLKSMFTASSSTPKAHGGTIGGESNPSLEVLIGGSVVAAILVGYMLSLFVFVRKRRKEAEDASRISKFDFLELPGRGKMGIGKTVMSEKRDVKAFDT